ncbi:hypothetical protein E1B28_006140 [Marasmius oreades]|uniref:Uncharacterized protein n=1 Tax=Marasmius oreades TaxID=181124 RepID=A0A9P7S7C2_9AGAR|nr:uncharacterized protein E1B28_006140 [Marasmius oreades]KAG7095383.1 hypothetical protein E1B28_006140 [Marasmius oreades]
MNVQKHSENTLDGSSSDNSSPPPPRSTLKESSQSQTKNHGKAPTSSAPTLLKSHLPVDTDRPLTEVISEPFMPFDHQAAVVDPFTREMARDANFEQELGTMLLDLILETHAWSSARPKYESQMAIQKLEQKVTDVVEIEKEQEKTRNNLNEFVTRMRTALAALTGL